MVPALRFGLVACTIAAAPALGATPCPDEPGTAGLACRTAELLEAATGLDTRVGRRVAAFAERVTSVGNACASGRTDTARRGLRALRARLIDARRAVDKAASRGAIDPDTAAPLLETLRLVDALRRATDARLLRHPCPEHVRLEFLLALPARNWARGIAPPFPVVVLQHGFAGDDRIVTQLAGAFTAAGLAAIGIPAPEHGPRGNFLDFFDFDDFNAFGDNWRQSSVDLLQLVRVIEHGIDVDGDAASDVDAGRLGYLGVSLGGVIGGVFTAVEPDVTTAVLNVPGGRLSQLAGASSPFAEPFLARFAAESGIPVRVCGRAPTDLPCTSDTDCGPGQTCRRNPDFTLLLQAAALDWQTQLDPGDGSAYARSLRLEPRTLAPRAVLVQEGIEDIIVANPLTEALTRAIALPANRADEAPDGVAGLWRFPPPAGHGILGLPEVRAQAITFLATGGRTLAPP